eukprot:TRINITY_DN2785_c0_g2_i1.p1 TRINITY_DN2785_c0_g2~~TRINITY_DN2785_c0_g2_i1.p1  ORF type:complete len:266 (-),score=52.32 TRINITY_DN2785_c0_g2_i1:198-995(-)
MIVEDVDTFVKIITVGNGAVGKTSLIRRFCEGVFTGQYQKTLAVDFVEKRDFEVKGVPEPVTLNVWDTAGQEEYNAITSTYYRGAHGCILCFASDDSKSLDDLDKWNSKVHEQCPGIPMLIVQTKVDLLSDRSKETISQEQAEAKAAALNMKLYRTSVKDDTNVQEGNPGQSFADQISQCSAVLCKCSTSTDWQKKKLREWQTLSPSWKARLRLLLAVICKHLTRNVQHKRKMGAAEIESACIWSSAAEMTQKTSKHFDSSEFKT